MSRDEILAMPAGREMDALIAANVLGWKVDDLTATSPSGSANSRTAHGDDWLEYYSTDMTAAWKVVEKLGFSLLRSPYTDNWTAAKITDVEPVISGVEVNLGDSEGVANSAPLAICRAALLAVTND